MHTQSKIRMHIEQCWAKALNIKSITCYYFHFFFSVLFVYFVYFLVLSRHLYKWIDVYEARTGHTNIVNSFMLNNYGLIEKEVTLKAKKI